MRVLFVIASLGVGGAERLLLNLAVRLKARGVDSKIVSVSSVVDATNGMACCPEIVTLGFDSSIFDVKGMVRASRALAAIVAAYKPDLIHSNVYIADVLSWLSVPRTVPLVSTLHGVDAWWMNRRRWLSRLKTLSYMALARWRRVRFVAVSDDVKQQADSMAGLSTNRIVVIPNGVDTQWFVPQADRAPQSCLIVQVGRFVPEKGHRTAIRALAALHRSNPSARLVLVGAGPLRDECEVLAASLGVRSAIDFVGRHSDVRPWLWAASVFWMPSETEGLPLACLEAMSCGLPIVASDVGGLPEIVDSTCGYVIRRGDAEELANATLWLLEQPARAKELGDAGRQKVRRDYSLDKAADAYMAMYKESAGVA